MKTVLTVAQVELVDYAQLVHPLPQPVGNVGMEMGTKGPSIATNKFGQNRS